MSIVEQLRFRSSCKDGIGFLPDEIVHVPARLLHLAIDEIARLTAENEKLRAALDEISKVTYGTEWTWSDKELADYYSMRFFRAQETARAALREKETRHE